MSKVPLRIRKNFNKAIGWLISTVIVGGGVGYYCLNNLLPTRYFIEADKGEQVMVSLPPDRELTLKLSALTYFSARKDLGGFQCEWEMSIGNQTAKLKRGCVLDGNEIRDFVAAQRQPAEVELKVSVMNPDWSTGFSNIRNVEPVKVTVSSIPPALPIARGLIAQTKNYVAEPTPSSSGVQAWPPIPAKPTPTLSAPAENIKLAEYFDNVVARHTEISARLGSVKLMLRSWNANPIGRGVATCQLDASAVDASGAELVVHRSFAGDATATDAIDEQQLTDQACQHAVDIVVRRLLDRANR